jgi:toxin CptA
MPSLNPSSDTSSSFRIDWRPSRWLVAGLGSLGALAGAALMLGDLPRPAAAALALGCVVRGLQLARQEWRRAACTLVFSGNLPSWRRVDADGRQVPLHKVRWHLRGPLAVMRGREASGRRCQFTWAPDTLCASQRRQLRLAGLVSSRSEKPLPAVAA